MIGGPQIILIIIVVLLLFGGRKIPELMRGLGSGIKEFKKATKEEEEETTDNNQGERDGGDTCWPVEFHPREAEPHAVRSATQPKKSQLTGAPHPAR